MTTAIESMQDRVTGSLSTILEGEWSPTTRVLIGLGGLALLAYGFRLRAPWACLVGSAGLGIAAEAIANANIKQGVNEAVEMVEERLGVDGRRGVYEADRLPADLHAR